MTFAFRRWTGAAPTCGSGASRRAAAAGMATDEATSGGVVVRLHRSAKETLTTAGILSTEDVVSTDDMLARENVVSAGGVLSAEDFVSTGGVFATEDVVSTGDSDFSNDEVSAVLGARTGVGSSEAT